MQNCVSFSSVFTIAFMCAILSCLLKYHQDCLNFNLQSKNLHAKFICKIQMQYLNNFSYTFDLTD